MNNKETSWGKVAGWYDDLLEKQEGTYQKDLILPNLMRILDPKKGETIFDIACGQGFWSRELQSRGAKVVAADIAPELIEKARQHSPKDIAYHVSPSHALDFAQKNSADKAIIILAIQNIEDLAATFTECMRVLKPGGKLILVLNHPAFRIPKRSSWEWDEKGKAQYRRIDAYMSDSKQRMDMTPGEENIAEKKFTLSFHRPLQVYFKALSKAGFAVTRLEEWVSHKQSNPGPRADAENKIRKEIPMFLMLEASKMQK